MKRWVVPVFVAWHLAFLAFRNPVSLWQEGFDGWVARLRSGGAVERVLGWTFDRIDRTFIAYEHALALDQGWRMFAAPLARSAPFPAVVVVLDDGTQELLRSDNEPESPDSFAFRESRSRLRKHEAQIVSTELEEMGLSEYWTRYLLSKCREWRAAHPGDSRAVSELVLVRRRYELPAPENASRGYGDPTTELVGSMSGASCNP